MQVTKLCIFQTFLAQRRKILHTILSHFIYLSIYQSPWYKGGVLGLQGVPEIEGNGRLTRREVVVGMEECKDPTCVQ